MTYPIPPHKHTNLLIMFQGTTNLNIQSLTQLLSNLTYMPMNRIMFILGKRSPPLALKQRSYKPSQGKSLTTILKKLAHNKVPSSYNIPMKSLKLYHNLPWHALSLLPTMLPIETFHDIGNIAKPYSSMKKIDPLILAKYRPKALANTIYKLYTSMLTTFLTSYGKQGPAL